MLISEKQFALSLTAWWNKFGVDRYCKVGGLSLSRMSGLFLGFLVLVTLPLLTCARPASDVVNEKASGQLLTQINLKKEQRANPTAERLEMMKSLGMNVADLERQRIFIHVEQELTPAQVAELEAMGITLYLDSWLPPAGNQPTGFLTADMPVAKLADLAKKAYVVRLETAERQLQPQRTAQPQQKE